MPDCDILSVQTLIPEYTADAIMRQDGGRAWLTIPEDFSLALDELHLAGGAHLALQPNDNRNRDFVLTVGRLLGTQHIHHK